MPIYAYRCATCGHAQDVLQKMSDDVLSVCPACGAATYEKQVTAAGFQLKGSGWYVTDFRGGNTGAPKKEGAEEGKSDKAEAGAADAKAADKPAEGAGDKGADKSSDKSAEKSADKGADKGATKPTPAPAAPAPTKPAASPPSGS